ncbi:hypothetical protein KJ785_01030 [Patescibacteria group bacterium]|nr:hypothetical protein [Patescibacteria group bacterium]
MNIGGWIITIFLGIIALLLLTNVIHWLYRKAVEHCFREYETWRRRDMPKCTLTVSTVDIGSDGTFSAILDHRRGAIGIQGETGDIIGAVTRRIPEIVSQLGKKDVLLFTEEETGQVAGSVTLRFDDLCFIFPMPKTDQ